MPIRSALLPCAVALALAALLAPAALAAAPPPTTKIVSFRDDVYPLLAARSGAAAPDFRRGAEVLAFFGIDPEAPVGLAGGERLAAAGQKGKLGIPDARDWCRNHPNAERKFWRPGDVIEPREVKVLRVYVLGPPTDRKQLFKALPTKSGRETYDGDEGHQVAAIARAFFGADVGLHDPDDSQAEFDGTAPFDRKYRVEMSQAADTDFYRPTISGSGRPTPRAGGGSTAGPSPGRPNSSDSIDVAGPGGTTLRRPFYVDYFVPKS